MKKIKPKPRPVTSEKQARSLRFGIYAGRMLAYDAIAMEGMELKLMTGPRFIGRLGVACIRTYNLIIEGELLLRAVKELGCNCDKCKPKTCNCSQFGPDCGIC